LFLISFTHPTFNFLTSCVNIFLALLPSLISGCSLLLHGLQIPGEKYSSNSYFFEEYFSFVSKIIIAHHPSTFNKSYFFHETFYLSTFLSFVCTIDLNIFSIHA